MSSDSPKKSLGQHWLHDPDSLEAMCHAAQVKNGDKVLEIGPGTGTLTQLLLEHGAIVHAVEADHELVPKLQAAFSSQQFQITEGSILEFDLTSMAPGYKVVANIPYYLTSNLLRVLCESSNPFSVAALLVQKEVAERVAAHPGDMSILSVSVQLYCEVGLGKIVGAKLFIPPPKVDSQILILKRRTRPLYENLDTKLFFRLVKAGFSERRKKLRSSLSGGLRISKEEATNLLLSAGLSPDLRAQALSLDDWYRLYATALPVLV